MLANAALLHICYSLQEQRTLCQAQLESPFLHLLEVTPQKGISSETAAQEDCIMYTCSKPRVRSRCRTSLGAQIPACLLQHLLQPQPILVVAVKFGHRLLRPAAALTLAQNHNAANKLPSDVPCNENPPSLWQQTACIQFCRHQERLCRHEHGHGCECEP